MHRIAWRPGTCHSIMIGRDRILGMGVSTVLSKDLIQAINRKGIYYFHQAFEDPRAGMVATNWYSGEALELVGPLLVERHNFRCDLINSGILFQDKPDALILTGGDQTGIISVKNVYLAVEKLKWIHTTRIWRKTFWSWDCPLKLKFLFGRWLKTEYFHGMFFNKENS